MYQALDGPLIKGTCKIALARMAKKWPRQLIEVANFIEVKVPNLFHNYFGTLVDLLQVDPKSFLASDASFTAAKRPRSDKVATGPAPH